MPRILVIDDTDANRYVISSWLRRSGYEVVEGTTGRAALDLVTEDTDLVVLDVRLPDMSGYEVCRAIKGDDRTASVTVMHVSATAIDGSARTAGFEGGADAYVTEPIDRNEFLAIVASLVRSRQDRRTAETVIDRLGRLASATLPLNAATSLPLLLEAAAAGAADVFDAPALVVADLGAGNAAWALVPARGAAPEIGGLAGPLTDVWASGPRVMSVADAPATWSPALERWGPELAAWYVSPLEGDPGRRGGLAVGLWGEPSPEDGSLLAQLTSAIDVALANLHAFAEEHRMALVLQRALLPGHLPAVPGLAFAARYHASSDKASVGGDFYDAYPLPSGRTVAVIGDVQGHSLRAATVMAELRHSLRAYVTEGHEASAALDLLNDLLQLSHPDETATVSVVSVDADRSQVTIANAGHLPPLVASSTGTRFVTESGPLLGVPSPPHPSVRVPVEGPTTLVMVTDGLVERRASSLDAQLDALAAVVAGLPLASDPDAVADALLERFADDVDDDVAVLVVSVAPPSA